MPRSRRASLPNQLTALLALSLACLRCSSDAVESGPGSNAGSSSHAGHAGVPATAGASGHGGVTSNEGGAAGETSTQAGAGPEAAGQAGAADVPANTIPDFNGCTAADYDDQSAADAPRLIGIATQGLTFTPPCLTIKAGQTVRWEGSLSSHPLAPGNPDDPEAGSADNPILETSSGQSIEFAFPVTGTFPYYCELHAFGNGQGMAGVVHVKP
jgi:plastocyanin